MAATDGQLVESESHKKVIDALGWSVQHLVERGLREVPKEYVQIGRKGFEYPVSEDDGEVADIPVIDFAKIQSGDAEEVLRLLNACEEWGFFQLANHGVPEELIDKAQSIARQFFNMPSEEKVEYVGTSPDILVRGYGRINYFVEDCPPDWGDTLAVDANSEADVSSWPTKPETIRETFWQYSQEVISLAIKLLKTIYGRGLGLPENFVESRCGPIGSQIYCNYYPRCPQPDLVYGLSAHSDPSLITLLLQNMEGLHVLKGERWRLVKPLHNHFVINLGDQAEILSNGKYKSSIHRVMVNNVRDRFSLVMFVRPSMEALMGPPAEILDDSHPAQFVNVKFKEYMELLENHGAFGKRGLDNVRVPSHV